MSVRPPSASRHAARARSAAAALVALAAAPAQAAAAAEGRFPWEWLIVVPALAALVLLWRLGGDHRSLGASRRRRRGGAQPLAQAAFPPTEADTQVDTQLDPRTVEPHRRIGPYLIERDIGRGAMGMVLLGRDLRSGDSVAIKTMALGREFHGAALEEARDRFFREAEMAGRLHHPDIVGVRGRAMVGWRAERGLDSCRRRSAARALSSPAVHCRQAMEADCPFSAVHSACADRSESTST